MITKYFLSEILFHLSLVNLLVPAKMIRPMPYLTKFMFVLFISEEDLNSTVRMNYGKGAYSSAR